jgi:hypothetical protein
MSANHVLEVRATGYLAETRRVQIEGGAQQLLTVKLGALAGAATPATRADGAPREQAYTAAPPLVALDHAGCDRGGRRDHCGRTAHPRQEPGRAADHDRQYPAGLHAVLVGSRAMSWTRVLLTLLALWLAACAESESSQARTQRAAAHSHRRRGAARPAERSCACRCFGREGAEWIKRGSHVHSMRQLHWPVDIPILPSSDEAATKDFEVIVQALDGATVLAQARVVSAFVPGDWRLLELRLFRCSGGSDQAPARARVCHGEACAEVCRERRLRGGRAGRSARAAALRSE